MILSVSRRTDVPAFYLPWFLNRMREGWFLTPQPRNPRRFTRLFVSPETVDCMVFWSKNPRPLLEHIGEVEALGIPFYLQYTLNPYGARVEPGLPPLDERVETFLALSERLGPQRMVWRYDPILWQEPYTAAYHEAAFSEMAGRLKGKTRQCVISFLDRYPTKMPGSRGVADHPLTQGEMRAAAAVLAPIARQAGMALSTCCEEINLADFGITHASCIDGKRIETMLGCAVQARKDAGQRPACGCAESYDVGSYNTCGHGCVYCYACSAGAHGEPWKGHDQASPLLFGTVPPDAVIFDKRPPSIKTGQTSLF